MLALVVFVVTAIFASQGVMATWEKVIFNFIYGWPEILTPFFLVITQLGSVFVFLILALIYLFKRNYPLVIRLLLTGTLAYLLAGLAKDLIGRPRPLELLLDVTYRDILVRGQGFPSAHAALATAVALTFRMYIPRKYRWTVPVAVIAVAVSRIYLGVHAPLDVIGGITIGWAAYALFKNVRLTAIHKTHTKKLNKVLKKHKKRLKLS